MEAEPAHIDDTLARLQAEPTLVAVLSFNALGWQVRLQSAADQPDTFRFVVLTDDHLMVDDVLDATDVRHRLDHATHMDQRRMRVMERLLTAEAETFLAGLGQ